MLTIQGMCIMACETDIDVDQDSAAARAEAPKPLWVRPTLSDYDIAGNTAITNCGSGSDGVICNS